MGSRPKHLIFGARICGTCQLSIFFPCPRALETVILRFTVTGANSYQLSMTFSSDAGAVFLGAFPQEW
jgi:hypothetical protein